MPQSNAEDLRAADYVLGLMEPTEAVLFERDMRGDPALADRVAFWRSRVAGVDLEEPTAHARMRREIVEGLRGPVRGAVVRPAPAPGNLTRRLLAAAIGAGLAIAAFILWRVIAL